MGRVPKMATHCLIVLVLVSAITTSTGQEVAAVGAPASIPAKEFLSQRCNKTQYPETCFDDLLPYAESLYGSRTKVTIAATTILMAKLDFLLAEMHGLDMKSPGQYNLGQCIKGVEALTTGKRERLANFKALEAIEDSKHTEKDTSEVSKWLMDVDYTQGECGDVMKIPNVTEVLPSSKGVVQFMGIADTFVSDLTNPKMG